MSKNVININGTDYDSEDLSNDQKYIINQIQDLQTKENSFRFQLDQVRVAREVFVANLIKSLETEEKEAETA
jgi:hypothetical protein|tara:strand:+ start:263 stop:478 length:216 start_codon:yes stop_codon:yes gene_type:complete